MQTNSNDSLFSYIPVRTFAVCKTIFMAIMGFTGLAIISILKVNIDVAPVTMVNQTAFEYVNKIDTVHDTTVRQQNGLDIEILLAYAENLTIQSIINLAVLIPLGILCDIASAKSMMMMAVALNCFTSSLSPYVAFINYWLYDFMRIVQGVTGTVTIPAMHVMVAKWARPNERSILLAIIYAGMAFGSSTGIPLTNYMIRSYGWQWISYIKGVLGVVWCTIWWLMINDNPDVKINEMDIPDKSYYSIPWRGIITSKPFFAIIIAHCSINFAYEIIVLELPKYLKTLFHLQSHIMNIALSVGPYFGMWLFIMILTKILIIYTEKQRISVCLSRRIGSYFSTVIPAGCLAAMTMFWPSVKIIVTSWSIAVTCLGGMFCGCLINHMDIAPNFVGTLTAISTAFASLPLASVVKEYFILKYTLCHGWKIILQMTGLILALAGMIYAIFNSALIQSWNKIESNDEKPKNMTSNQSQLC